MTKSKKITYWIATVWLALGMVSTGLVQLSRMPEESVKFNELGYPAYLMTLLGVWKILGSIAVLIPRFALLKEWAYAGFAFDLFGATFSGLAASNWVFDPRMSGMLMWIVPGILSYVFWKKKMQIEDKQKQSLWAK